MEIKAINVTSLEKACIDNDWLQDWLEGKNPDTRNFTSDGGIKSYGTDFHLITAEFLEWLNRGDISPDKISDFISIWDHMYSKFAKKRIMEIIKEKGNNTAHKFVKSIEAFCKRLIELKMRMPGFQSWKDIFPITIKQWEFKDIQFSFEGNSVFVSGKSDTVRRSPDGSLEIVDYKLTKGNNLKYDILQLAIYWKCFSKLNPDKNFRGVLEYYLPELHEVVVSRDELNSLFANMVEPTLRKIAEYKRSDSKQYYSVDKDFSQDIIRCFSSFNLVVEVIDKLEAPQLTRYKIHPGPGVKVSSLASRADDLQVLMSLQFPPLIGPAQGCVTIDLPKEKPAVVSWEKVMQDARYKENHGPVSFPIGVGVDASIIIADFADPNMCHALIAGASGSGKSEFLKSMIASLILKNSPQTLQLSLVDPKILTFSIFNDNPFLKTPVVTDIHNVIPCLVSVVVDMEERYLILGKEGFSNLSERFYKGRKDIPFHIIVFDEFADLVLSSKEEKKEFENLVAKIAGKGRAAGIHLVLATQRPDKNIVQGLIKANLPLKVCLRVINSANSQIILDEQGGESLLGRGDLLCNRGKGIERAQSPFITQDKLKEIVLQKIL